MNPTLGRVINLFTIAFGIYLVCKAFSVSESEHGTWIGFLLPLGQALLLFWLTTVPWKKPRSG